MPDNRAIILGLYAYAEGDGLDMKAFVSAFSDDGYMTDVPAGLTLRGKAIGDYIGALTSAFPDIHRELFQVYVSDNVVIVELAIAERTPALCHFPRVLWLRLDELSTCHVAMSSIWKMARSFRSIAITLLP